MQQKSHGTAGLARVVLIVTVSVLCLIPLTVYSQVFSDDFETGTPCIWSGVVPQSGDTIYEIQQGLISGSSPVDVSCAVVTAIASSGFFVQHPSGGQYSGIYVYAGSNYQTTYGAIALGSILQVTGTYEEYNDVSEINCLATGYTVVSAMSPLAPTVVATSDLQLAVAEPWESVLVSVENVTVTNADLGFNEWQVSALGYDVIIDNYLHDYISQVTLGEVFSYINGPLNYSFGAFKIAPRGDEDLLPEG